MNVIARNGYTVIRMPEEAYIDHSMRTSDQLSLVVNNGGKEFILDMDQVAAFRSAGASLLAFLIKKVKEIQGKLSIVNAGKRVRDVLCILNLDRIVPVFESEMEYEFIRARI